MKRVYQVTIRGEVPEDIVEWVSALWALAIGTAKPWAVKPVGSSPPGTQGLEL